ncbi:MAG: tRNA (adenosine(37)-N6)-dimethylallyltransferase MiaA [bacterium]|nr:tRNA (adenosine(37)-N6)-dimethylallyltransferase MiaA [bacterium]
MSKIILIVGPTAVGKTYTSIKLAKYLNAEIINADSRYIYKEPVIATAKVTKEEMLDVKHHMIDICSLNDDYTIFDFQKDGRRILDKLISENKNIIIVGGSGLYIKALLYDYVLEETKIKKIDYSNYSNKELKDMIDKIDENNDIHINNRQRMERYLSYYQETGKTISKTENANKKLYNFISIGLTSNRELIYQRINDRVDYMFNNGLLDEAKKLYDLNLKNYSTIIGYKELKEYFDGNISIERAKELIKQNSRHYAKRQFTWFNNQMNDIKWFDVNYENINNTIDEIKEYINY